MSCSIPIVKFDEAAKIPNRAHGGDAGYDLCATETVTLKPLERKLIGTGLGIAIPEGYAGFVLPRSGLAIKTGLSIVNAPGLIDSNYRGELKVIAINLDAKNEITIVPGDRIAQLVIQKVADCNFVLTDCLDESERGEGGFGSSGGHGSL